MFFDVVHDNSAVINNGCIHNYFPFIHVDLSWDIRISLTNVRPIPLYVYIP